MDSNGKWTSASRPGRRNRLPRRGRAPSDEIPRWMANVNAPVERYGGGAIAISDYDPAWSAMFEKERASVQAALRSFVLNIEHIGSTAVPGLAAKPIIDLLVGITDLDQARSCCIEPLLALGYVYIPEYESWLPNELFFRKGGPGPWTHHVHIMEPRNRRWEHRLLFRDYLRAHPSTAHAYAKLKKNLAAQFGDDIAAYRSAKHEFVEQTVARARAER
jgi:GrpB-like predicted nucleotidyltransferase (UPF0157 family)